LGIKALHIFSPFWSQITAIGRSNEKAAAGARFTFYQASTGQSNGLFFRLYVTGKSLARRS